MSTVRHLRLTVVRVLSLVFIINTLTINPLVDANPSDEAELRTLVERFFAAYQKKDLNGVMSLWSEKSPERASGEQSLQRAFAANEKIELKSAVVNKISLEGDKATVSVVAELSAAGRPGEFEKMNRTIRFIKEGPAWRVWSYASSEEELAAALVAAGNEEDQNRLLARQNEINVPELRRAIIKMGRDLYIGGRIEQALGIYNLAQRIAERLNDRQGVADAVRAIGNVSLSKGDPEGARQSYDRSLKISRELGDKTGIGSTLHNIGLSYFNQGIFDRAIENYQKSLELREELGVKVDIANTMTGLGSCYASQGDYKKGLKYYLKSLELNEVSGDVRVLTSTLTNIGSLFVAQGDYARALEYYERSAKLNESSPDKRGLANTLTNIGRVHGSLGNYTKAMEFHQASLRLSREAGERSYVANALGNIGNLYYALRNFVQALDYYQQNLAISRETKDHGATAASLNNIGLIHCAEDETAKALESFNEAASIYEMTGNRPGVTLTMNNIGLAYFQDRNYEKALYYYEKGLKDGEQFSDRNLISLSLTNIGQVYLAKGEPAKALDYAERAAVIAREIGKLDQLWQQQTVIGLACRRLDRLDRARQAFDQAIATIEQMRDQVAAREEDKQRFFEEKVAPYYGMVDLLINQNSAGEALAYAERAKARVLLDVLQRGRANINRAMTDQERLKEKELNSEVISLNGQIARANKTSPPDLAARLQKARLEYEAFQTSLYAVHPELKVQRGRTEPFTMQQANALLPDSGTALIEFAVGADNTCLFVLTRSGTSSENNQVELKAYQISIKAKELSSRVARFLKGLAEGSVGFREPARQLYDILLKPAERQLRGKTTLCIVPDGVLWEMPFQALQPRDGVYLLQDHAVFYAPSLSVFREMVGPRRRKGRPPAESQSLLAFGNPALSNRTIERAAAIRRDDNLAPLPNTEKEVKFLAQLYGSARSQVFIGPEAREERVKREAGKFRILHFATHGMLDDGSPLYSRLLLSQLDNDANEDGLLEAREIMEMDLKADLAILSACQTGRGRIGAGEGVIGMSWAFFVAGCPTTVVSQWMVDSASTTELMMEFHRQLTSQRPGSAGVSKAQALQRAALSLLRKKKYSHPFYWAGFIVVGDGT